MYGFSSKVQGLLQLLKEGEREEAMAKLDPSIAKKLKERRNKERPAGSGGLNPEMDLKVGHRRSGVPEEQDMGKAMLESSGKYYLQNNPAEVKYSEEE
jgi:hypothetical protein